MSDPVRFDGERYRRIGLHEAILCEGKSPDHLLTAITAAEKAHPALLLTRLERDVFENLPAPWRRRVDYDPLSRTGIVGDVPVPASTETAVVTAGTADLRVAREATRTLSFCGIGFRELADLGVAGLWRVLDVEENLRTYRVVIVVAGMDGALFSVLAGLVPGVVIAVPTSVGYGASRGGETALHAALASCAPGLVVVNVDNGYGAACAARRILGSPAASA